LYQKKIEAYFFVPKKNRSLFFCTKKKALKSKKKATKKRKQQKKQKKQKKDQKKQKKK